MHYSGDSRGHSVAEVSEAGRIVILEDGSRWEVYEGFASRSLRWQAGDLITVKPGSDDEFPYLLVNINFNDSVESRLIRFDAT